MSFQLVFLPEGGFYLNADDRPQWTPGLDPMIIAILRALPSNGPSVRRVLSLETIVESTGVPSSFMSYYDDAGQVQTQCNFKHSHPKLDAWIQEQGVPNASVQINLGLNGQFFARSNQSCQSSGDDETLEESIQELKDGQAGWRNGRVPERVLFGCSGSHLVTCHNGGYLSWNPQFEIEYPSLRRTISEHLTDPSKASIYKYITISPYISDQWLVIWGDGTIEQNLPPRIASALASTTIFFQSKSGGISRSPTQSSGSGPPPSSRRTSSSSLSSPASATPYPGSPGSPAGSYFPPTFRPVQPVQPVYPVYRPLHSPYPSIPSHLFSPQPTTPSLVPSVPSHLYGQQSPTQYPAPAPQPIYQPTPYVPYTGPQQSNDPMQMLHLYNSLNQQMYGGNSYGTTVNMNTGGGNGGLDAYNAMLYNGGVIPGSDPYAQSSAMFTGTDPMGADSARLDATTDPSMGMGGTDTGDGGGGS